MIKITRARIGFFDRVMVAAGLGSLLFGCNALDGRSQNDGEPILVIPVDNRDTLRAAVPPVPISGGTLRLVANGTLAVVSDPDRDLITIANLSTASATHSIVLEKGDEPGRSVEDALGRVHVALRRGGAVLSFDPLTGVVFRRQAVCKSPRGIAFESSTGLLHVACAEGKLISLDAATGTLSRTLELETDLRDVLVRGSELWVTRFKSAEVLRISAQGTRGARIGLPQGQTLVTEFDEQGASRLIREVRVQPEVAWRALPTSDGGAIIVHQQAVIDEVPISAPNIAGSSYGGGAGPSCDGIVKNALSVIGPDGRVMRSEAFVGAPLPVDVSVAPNGSIAIAHAGLAEMDAPRPFIQFPSDSDGDSAVGGRSVGFGESGAITVLPASPHTEPSNPCVFGNSGGVGSQVVAVAYAPDGRLIAQVRQPSQLLILSDPPWGVSQAIVLPGAGATLDTGHEIFHRDAGGGIACASCHPEGGEDGHVWNFASFGPRRTQALHVGLRGTAPFHWDGGLEDVGDIMSAVFVGRMGGVRQNGTRLSALSEWLFAIKPPPAIRDASDVAVTRGQALFHSASANCASCHAGGSFTDNRTLRVTSSGPALQVPSLVAIGYRAPFMHDGCAATLADRFNPSCGGTEHGNTAQLSDAERQDLVAYLESL